MHEAWDEFRRTVLLSSAPDQIQLVRAAFYSGAAVLHQMLTDMKFEGEPTEADINAVREIASELEEFIQATREQAERDLDLISRSSRP